MLHLAWCTGSSHHGGGTPSLLHTGGPPRCRGNTTASRHPWACVWVVTGYATTRRKPGVKIRNNHKCRGSTSQKGWAWIEPLSLMLDINTAKALPSTNLTLMESVDKSQVRFYRRPVFCFFRSGSLASDKHTCSETFRARSVMSANPCHESIITTTVPW